MFFIYWQDFLLFSWVEKENCRAVLNIAKTWVNPDVTAKGGPRTHFLIMLLCQLYFCVSRQLRWIHSLTFPFLFSTAERSFWRGNRGTNCSFWVLSCWKREFLNRFSKYILCVKRRIALCHQPDVENSGLKVGGLGEVSGSSNLTKGVLCFWPTLVCISPPSAIRDYVKTKRKAWTILKLKRWIFPANNVWNALV